MDYLCPKLKDMNIERLRIYDRCLRSNKGIQQRAYERG